MKSIKEKAEDIQLGYDDIQAPAIGRGFVLGANYVLDVIQGFVIENHFNLEYIVEKLKSNQ